jgi:hypothetical protein
MGGKRREFPEQIRALNQEPSGGSIAVTCYPLSHRMGEGRGEDPRYFTTLGPAGALVTTR